jgi:hypothetical protein
MSDTKELVQRFGDVSVVIREEGYYNHLLKTTACEVTDTGNGFIIKFPAHNATVQDYYVCLDYAQASYMIHGMSAFKEELGFTE